MSDLADRIERLESLEEIRQLAAKYALALDMRDADAWVGLFPSDVRVGDGQQGRSALKVWFHETMSASFTGTAHFTGNHIIEFDDPDHARGVVYSRNEHECHAEWVAMTMMYWDAYERIDGTWLFRRRLPLYWYAADLNKPPIGPDKMRWPGEEPYEGGFHEFWPTWRAFWEGERSDVVEPLPGDEFLQFMRRGRDELPSVRVR